MLESSQLQAADLLARAVKELIDQLDGFAPRTGPSTRTESDLFLKRVMRVRSAFTIYSEIRVVCGSPGDDEEKTEPALRTEDLLDLAETFERVQCPACGSTDFNGSPGCSCCDVSARVANDEPAPVTQRTA